MAVKKSYDKYNMFSSSTQKEDDEKQKNTSVAARIFERRGQALKQDGTTSSDYGMSPAEVFRRRKDLLKTATQRTPEQADILRSDREQAVKEYANIQRKKFQNDFYGDMSPNTFMDSASSEELSALGKIERNRTNLQDITEEYAKVRAARAGNTIITGNLDTANSADISEMGKQARKAGQKAYQRQKNLDRTGFKDEKGTFIQYDSLDEQPDFSEMVSAGKTKRNLFNTNDATSTDSWDEYLADPFNPDRINEAKGYLNINSDGIHGPLDYLNKDKRAVMTGSQYNFTQLTDTEKDMYYYINGKYGAQTATNYIKSINQELNRRNAEKVQANAAELAKEHPVLGTGLDAGIALAGSGAYPPVVLGQMYNNMMGNYQDIDPNDPMFGASIINEGLRSGVTDNETLKKVIPNEGMRGFLTGTGLSMLENIARLPMGHLGLAVAAGDAGLSGTRDAVQRGGSNEQAVTLGAANAAAEAFFEKFSLEGLQSLKASPGKGVKEFLKNVGKQAVTEGSEEVFTEIANTASDKIIMENLSQYNLEYESYIQQGMDESTAKKTALQSFLKNVAVAGAGGALSGGLMGGGGQVLGMVQENQDLNQYGKDIDVDYRDYAQGLNVNPESYANESDYQEATKLQRIAEEYAAQQRQGKYIPNRDKAEYDIRLNQFMNNISHQEDTDNQHQTVQNQQEPTFEDEAEYDASEPEKPEYGPYTSPEPQMESNTQADKNMPEYQEERRTEGELDAWAEVYGKEGQQAFKAAYDDETDLPTYYRAFAQAYNAGRYNMEPRGRGRAEAAIILSPEQFTDAFKAGAHDRNTEIGYEPETYQMRGMVQGTPKEGGLGIVSENASDAQKKVAGHIGKLTGLEINLVDEMPNTNAAGAYEKGKITLSINSSDFNASAAHELTHFIKDYASDVYQIYQDKCVKALMESKSVDLEDLLSDYTVAYEREGQQLSSAEAMDEIVADATQKFLNDPDFISSVVHDDVNLAQKIINFFTDVIESLKELIKTGSTKKAAKGLEENLEYLEDCRKTWFAGVDEAGERYKSGMELESEGREKQALEKPDMVTDSHIDGNYEKVRTMETVKELTGNEFEKGEKDLITQVSEFYKSVGGKVHNEVVGDIYFDRDSVKDDIGHGIGRAKAITFAAVPDILQCGYVLDYKRNWKNRGYDSAVIGAKISIAEGKQAGEYYGLAVVKLLDDNKMYLHEVYTTKVGDVMPFKTPDLKGGKTRSDTYTLPPIYSIFDRLRNVNEQSLKYQLEDVDESVTQKRLDAIIYENQMLKEANKLLEKQFELTSKSTVRQEDVGKVAKKLLKDYNSTYKQETLQKNLDRLYEYIRSAEQVDGMEVTEAATSIAKSVLKNSQQIDVELTRQYKDLRNQVKNTKIKISDQDKADLAAAGGYNEFRKRNFGRMKLGNDGISVDSLYQELSGQHPELFPEDVTHPADQLMAIASALEQTDAQVDNPYHANMDEMAFIVGQDILQSYFDVRQERPTFADRKAAEVERVKKEYSHKMSAYKDKLKQDYKAAEKSVYRENQKKMEDLKNTYNNLSQAKQREMKDYYKQRMDELRSQKNQKMAAMQSRNREQIRKVYDSQRAREAKKSIIKEAKTLQGWLLKPTDSKHIPESLRTTVAGFLNNIDFSANEQNNNGIPTLRTQEWEKIKKEFDKIIKNGGTVEGEDGSYVYMEIDPDMLARIEDITQKVEGIDKLDNLDAYTLEEIKKVVISMKKAITEVNSVKSNKKYGNLSMLADDMFSDLEIRRNKTEYTGLIGKPDKLLNYDMLDPQTMFEQLGPAAKTTYNALRNGLDKKTLKLKEAQDHIKKVMSENNITAKDIRKWSGREAGTERFKVFGGEIELTIADIMSLYELNKRPAARGHIYDRNGGIKPEARNIGMRLENGKLTPAHIEKSLRAVRVTESDVKMITDTLSPEQKRIADSIQGFMGDVVAGWGNEVTMEMYGYNKFTAGQYFPIDVDKSNLPTKEGEAMNQMGAIKNMGITKSTQEHAHKPIIIGDIFDVYSRQVDKMSSYNAYVIPLSDLQKVYNYIDMRTEKGSIKEQIGRTFGKAGNDYIHKLLLDINESIKTETGFIDSMLSNMKAASVAGNLRVAIQQPTAYLRASMEISPMYLAMGAKTMTRKGQWELICQYAPIAQWKDWGFYRMDTSRQMKDIMFGTDSKKQQFVNWTMTAAEVGDKVAWNRLWRACEYECMDKHPELKQESEEFYHQVGERFSEIIDKTQVVDSVLHRTQIMRSQNMGTKMATSFMAEPLKTYDMLYRAAMDVKAGKDKSRRRAARAAAVFVATNVATALAAAAVDAARDDDRKKGYKEKYKEAAWDNFKDGMNIINNIPYAKDAVSAFAGYSQTRADTAAYQDLYYAYKKLGKIYSGDSELTPQYVALYTAEMSSKLLGLPIRSISRDAQAISDTLMHGLGKESDDYTWLKQKYNIGSKQNLNLYVGMMIEAHRSNDAELQQRIKDDLNATKIDNDTISNKIKSLIKGELISKDYIDPRIDAAARAKMEMDLGTYESSVEELIAEGYAGKIIGSAINSRLTQLTTGEDIDWEAEAATEPDELYGEVLTGRPEVDDVWSLYASGDIIKAIEMFDNTSKSLETFNHIAASMVDSKVKSGKTEKEAISNLKSTITRRYKVDWIAAYNAGNRYAYEAILNKLKYLKVNGKTLYSGDDWVNWRKEANKK